MTTTRLASYSFAFGTLLAPFAFSQADRGHLAEPRRAIFGLVTDANGHPVEGATVHLVGAVASPVWNAPPDVLRTTTDEVGRWRAEVRECVEYTTWAVGRDLVSEVATGVVPGPSTELSLRHSSSRSIRIAGLDAWRDREPLRARLWLDGGSRHHTLVPIRDGSMDLPVEWPHSSFVIELVGDDGASIHVARQMADSKTARVAEPREIDILVEGPDGKPLAGAEICCEDVLRAPHAEIGPAWQRFEFVVGRTGNDGRLRARIGTAWEGKQPDLALFLRARKACHSDVCGGWGWERRSFSEGLTDDAGPDAPETEAGVLRLRMRPAMSARGRLSDGAVAVAECPVAVTARRRIYTRDRASYFVSTMVVTSTDSDGGFEVPGVTPEEIQRIQFGAHDAIWGDAVPTTPAPGQPLFAPVSGGGRLEFDIARTARVTVQALRPDGGPASNAVLLVLPMRDPPRFLTIDDPHYRLDRAGRTSLLLERDTRWFVLAVDGICVQACEIDPNTTSGRIELAMRELPRLRVRVFDRDGRPAAGARLRHDHFGCKSGVSQFETQLALLTSRLYLYWFDRTRTDADGWLELPMFAESPMQFEVYATKDGRRSETWPLRYGKKPIEVRLTANR